MPDTAVPAKTDAKPKSEAEKQAAQNDLAGVLQQLASNLPEGVEQRQLTGPERAAILMLALGDAAWLRASGPCSTTRSCGRFRS